MRELTVNTLAHLDGEAKEAALAALVAAARTTSAHTTKHLKARIRTYELRYEMTTEQLLRALQEGRQKETADIADWLFWHDALLADQA
jgi:predicted Fe-Mo cluster-binding NifX family protein